MLHFSLHSEQTTNVIYRCNINLPLWCHHHRVTCLTWNCCSLSWFSWTTSLRSSSPRGEEGGRHSATQHPSPISLPSTTPIRHERTPHRHPGAISHVGLTLMWVELRRKDSEGRSIAPLVTVSSTLSTWSLRALQRLRVASILGGGERRGKGATLNHSAHITTCYCC